MRVSDVMTRRVTTTNARTAVRDAVAVLAGHGVRALPVVDDEGVLIGMLSEAEVFRSRVPADPSPRHWRGTRDGDSAPTTVGEVMSRPALTTGPEADAAELAAAMIDRGVRSVPVVRDGRLVGIVTRRDLVRTIARSDALIAADIRRRLEAYGGLERWTVHVRDGAVTISDEYADPSDHHVALVLAQAVPGVVHVKVGPGAPRMV